MTRKKLDRPVSDILKGCLNDLMSVRESGYWPFASPAPCSTEVHIKESIDKAISSLESAVYWDEQMFGKQRRNPMRAPSSVITETQS